MTNQIGKHVYCFQFFPPKLTSVFEAEILNEQGHYWILGKDGEQYKAPKAACSTNPFEKGKANADGSKRKVGGEAKQQTQPIQTSDGQKGSAPTVRAPAGNSGSSPKRKRDTGRKRSGNSEDSRAPRSMGSPTKNGWGKVLTRIGS